MLRHLIRGYEDAAESWPGAIWPGQAQRALRGLIRAWHAARERGQPEIPPPIRDPLIKEFRHAVLAGLSDLPRIPGPKHARAQHPGRDLRSSAATARAMSCGSATTPRSGPPTTSPSAA